MFICGFGVWSLIHGSTVYTFTANDFFSVLECFFISVFVSLVVSILGSWDPDLTFCTYLKECLSAGFHSSPSQGILIRL